MYSRLARRLRATGLASFTDYLDQLERNALQGEWQAFTNALTTNLTSFFREPHHFEHLRRKVIEPAAADIRSGQRLRIWSAGCSSGQEPYSIALTLLDDLAWLDEHRHPAADEIARRQRLALVVGIGADADHHRVGQRGEPARGRAPCLRSCP